MAKAMGYLERVPAADRDPRWWNSRGMIMTYSGDQAGAIAAYLKALEMSPGDADFMCNLTMAYVRAGDARNARAMFDRFRAAAPGDRRVNGVGSEVDRLDRR
jgi:Flp pilus assembly protein TadD